MFLRAVTLSDVVTADGWNITIPAWEGQQDETVNSTYQWPRTQKTLSAKHWKLWRSTLEKTVVSGNVRRLQTQLLE
jgi:hypothetical protein